LKHIFGFCEDYDNVLFGFNYVLTLTRQRDNDAIIREDAAGAGKITLNKLQWMMPQCQSQQMNKKLAFFKTIQAKADLPVAFLSPQM
jgi:hypothetical protein